jgi:hypothetical protein
VEIFNFLCSIFNADFVCNPPHAFEVGIWGRNLEVEKQVAISLRKLTTCDYVLTIAKLFGVSIR